MFKHKNSKPDPSQFLAAARENNVSRMKDLLEAGAELESIAAGLALIGEEPDLNPWCERAPV